MDALTVEYDASRLKPAEVESALAGAGIQVERHSDFFASVTRSAARSTD